MTAILTSPFDSGLAWKGADMQRSDAWLYRFSQRALDEIDAAVETITARGLEPSEITKETFSVPSLVPDLARIAHELENGRGFVQMKGLRLAGEAEAETVFWGISAHLGRAIPQNPQGDLIGHVRDEGLDITKGDVRAYQTRVSQGFHTDIAGDVVGLMCLRSAKSGGKSRVASAMAVYNELLARYPHHVGLLYNGYNVDWRGEQAQGAPPVYREPIYAYVDGKLTCRFSPRFIRTAQEKTGVKLSTVEEEAISAVQALSEELCFEIEFDPGDIQYINNLAILHGRTGYEDYAEPERRRHLLRVWLNVPGARKLPAEFASGPARSGIPLRASARPSGRAG